MTTINNTEIAAIGFRIKAMEAVLEDLDSDTYRKELGKYEDIILGELMDLASKIDFLVMDLERR